MTSLRSTENPTPGGLIDEYLSILYPPNHCVMQYARHFMVGFSWHGVYFSFSFFFVNLFPYQPLPLHFSSWSAVTQRFGIEHSVICGHKGYRGDLPNFCPFFAKIIETNHKRSNLPHFLPLRWSQEWCFCSERVNLEKIRKRGWNLPLVSLPGLH